MTPAPIYRIEPHYEPDGPGAGWDLAPADHLATVFAVVRTVRDPEHPDAPPHESIIASEPSRRAAESIVARLTAARRLDDLNPPPPPPVKRAPMLARFLMGLPIVAAFWFLAGVLRAWLHGG